MHEAYSLHVLTKSIHLHIILRLFCVWCNSNWWILHWTCGWRENVKISWKLWSL